MSLSLNEIKKRAIEFSNEWKNETSEDSEAKSFWDGFFNIFGISRKRIATFEEPVKKLGNKRGFIDLFWKGTLIVEHKSRGKDLDKAYSQALEYFDGLKEEELPKYVLVSDFARFRLYDLEERTERQFDLTELYNNIHLFDFILGHNRKKYKDEDPVNIKAAELMGKLHDALKDSGYDGHQLEIFLVRLMFCLFADDTGVFNNKDDFTFYIDNKTKEDGTDLGVQLSMIFQILNTPVEKRNKNLDEDLSVFPYVNGKLFEEPLPFPSFDSKMREIMLECCYFDWSRVSPAIFGSMFQSVMDKNARRNLGAHYTSEKNILKIVKSLFLDELYAEFDKLRSNLNGLHTLLDKIKELKLFDPACGCGNFLIISYRELRLLEIEIHKEIQKIEKQIYLDERMYSGINVDAMFGIEIEEFPARIGQVALWIVDHQMNVRIWEEFGYHFTRLPLKASANIVNGNALQLDWETIAPKDKLNYILGNPPFVGKQLRNKEQNDDMESVFEGQIKNYGVLDYVTSWYVKASDFIQGTKIKCAFVSTNSITQGEQVGILWEYLLSRGIKIHFAHRTFKWSNEAKGNAGVYCVIIGFANFDIDKKRLFDYSDVKGEPVEIEAKNINPYLVNQKDIVIKSRNNPINNVPKMSFGNMPLDGGNLLFSDEEKIELILKEPDSMEFIKPFISAREFLHNEKRWCLWLVDADPSKLKKNPYIMERINKVKEFRLSSIAPSTRKFAEAPSLFRDRNNPEYTIVIPRVSSENRKYIPMGFFDKNNIVGDTCMSLPDATLYHFGILTSAMHMAWTSHVCGRLKSDFRYSKDIVYNNFPWPDSPTLDKYNKVENAAKEVLAVREKYMDSSLADLYDPLTMPKDLLDAHKRLDKAVDLCYRSQPFVNELARLEFLFDLYERYTSMFGR